MNDLFVGDVVTDMPAASGGKALHADRAATAAPRSRRARIIRAGDVSAKPVEWLWPDRIPAGMLTVLGGNPGLGKSLLTVHLAAKVTQGCFGANRAEVVFLTAEDSIEHTIVPRLRAAGADLNRIQFPSMERDGFEMPMLLPKDVSELRRIVLDAGVRLVVIDPLMAHLDSVNSWKDQEIREALSPVQKLAEESGAAFVLVAHLNKGQSTDPLQRLGGSVGLPAAARSVLLLAPDPDDQEGEAGDRRVLAHVKSNVSELAPSLLLEIEPVLDGDGETAAIRQIGFSPYLGAQLLIPGREPRGSKRLEAIAFLQAELASGERPAAEVEAAALRAAISTETLRRARRALDVESRKLDFEAGWVWSLPEQLEASAA